MTDPTIIQDTLELGKTYYSEIVYNLLVDLNNGTCIDTELDCENSYGMLEYVLAALNYQVQSNIYNGTTEVLYEQLVKILGDYVPEVVYTQLDTPEITIEVISDTQINISWTDVDNAVSYQLQRATNISFSANLTTLSTADVLLYNNTGLTAATQYYYRVKAVAETGSLFTDSDYDTGNGTTDSAPLATIYYGWKDDNTELTEEEILDTVTTVSYTEGAADYTIPWQTNTGIKFLWWAELLTEPLKTKWQDTVVVANNGNIGTEDDLFGAAVEVGTLRFYQSVYATTASYPIQIKVS